MNHNAWVVNLPVRNTFFLPAWVKISNKKSTLLFQKPVFAHKRLVYKQAFWGSQETSLWDTVNPIGTLGKESENSRNNAYGSDAEHGAHFFFSGLFRSFSWVHPNFSHLWWLIIIFFAKTRRVSTFFSVTVCQTLTFKVFFYNAFSFLLVICQLNSSCVKFYLIFSYNFTSVWNLVSKIFSNF